jgi:uncharacterized protein (DUF2252 family)
MAGDLATTPASGLRVQACGDAHLMNFGGFATPERTIIFDVNDLDETLPAPFEWDLKRLAASVVIAAEHLMFPNSDTAPLLAAGRTPGNPQSERFRSRDHVRTATAAL